MAAERTLKMLADSLLHIDGMISKQRQEEDTYDFVNRMKNTNTKSKTKSDLKRAREWLQSVGEERDIIEIPPKELNVLLARMFINIRKIDNGEYEPDTVKGIQSSIHRYLIDNNYGSNILTDLDFKHSRDVMDSKRKLLKGEGYGNKKNRADPITDDELNILRRKCLLGSENPEALSNAMWLNNTTHFGLRGRQEHTTMLWGDIELCGTSTGVEYLAFTERCTKTRNGISSDPRAFLPKMFEQPDDEFCPVRLYKLYADKRPEEMRKPDARFYVAVNPNYGKKSKDGAAWFISGPMGKNKIGQIAKTMSEKGGLSGRHTNHSGRKTTITKLMDAQVAPTDVAQLSGHKNLLSLNHYNTVSLRKQQEMSTILHKVSGAGDNSKHSHLASTSHINKGSSIDDSYVKDDNSLSDDKLVCDSQELETALQAITRYENPEIEGAQVVNLPIIHNSDGSLSVQESKKSPKSLFVNCNFHCPVNIVFK